MSRACIVIPARYASSRFPGKPLAPIFGKPMILWVAELSAKAIGKQHVYIATDNDKIRSIVEDAGFSSILTSASALTGSDRVAEAAEFLDYDLFINIQGDEPMVEPEDILRCKALKESNPDSVVNGYTSLLSWEDPNSFNIPKVIFNESQQLVYMSRSVIPGSKSNETCLKQYYKQVCIYVYSKAEIARFSLFGRKSHLELIEDIEILRFLELNTPVIMCNCRTSSIAVDLPEDIKRVEQALQERVV